MRDEVKRENSGIIHYDSRFRAARSASRAKFYSPFRLHPSSFILYSIAVVSSNEVSFRPSQDCGEGKRIPVFIPRLQSTIDESAADGRWLKAHFECCA